VQLAFLNATAANVFVAVPAGNGGPAAGSVQHPAPWVTTTGASTHDVFEGGVRLGSGATVVGAMLSDRRVGPARLVDARDVAAADVPARRSALCYPGSLDARQVDGAIVVCDRGVIPRVSKSAAVAQAGGRAMVLINTVAGSVDADLHAVPTVHLDLANADRVKAYLATAGADATATIVPQASDDPPVPALADFSGRGPAPADGDLLKPDLTAPGVSVVSAVAPPAGSGDTGSPLWDVESGTSIAAPHVAGVAAVVRAAHPTWTSAAIKSAMITTAHQLAVPGTPLGRGAGELDSSAVLDPGLVYDTPLEQWDALVEAQSPGLQGASGASAPVGASDVNAPSIAVDDLVGRQTVTRSVTNVGAATERYTVAVTGLFGVAPSVSPDNLTLRPGQSADFTVTFTATKNARYDAFTSGSLTWRDSAGHVVTSPVIVRPELASSPAEVTGTGRSGTLAIHSTAGITGSLRPFTRGLAGATPVDLTLDPGSFDPARPATSASTASEPLEVPPGARAARFEVSSGSRSDDVDLYVYRGEGLVASAVHPSGTETVTLTSPSPGTYRVYVTAHRAAAMTAHATLTSWVLPRSAPASLQLGRHLIGVNGGESFSVTARWTDLDPRQRWWGYVGLRGRPGVTYVTLN
jgi:fibronectin type III domain protein/subtilase family protein/PA domain-containing protein